MKNGDDMTLFFPEGEKTAKFLEEGEHTQKGSGNIDYYLLQFFHNSKVFLK